VFREAEPVSKKKDPTRSASGGTRMTRMESRRAQRRDSPQTYADTRGRGAMPELSKYLWFFRPGRLAWRREWL